MKQQRALEKARQVLLAAEKEKLREKISRDVQKFLSGDRQVLNHEDFSIGLSPFLLDCYQNGRRQHVRDMLVLLGESVCDSDHDLREKAVDMLTKCSAALDQFNDLDLLRASFNPLVAWISCEENYISGFGLACSQLHRLTQKLLANKKYWSETEQLLITLHHIQEGVIERNSSIRGMVVKLLESLATKQLLENLITSYLQEKSNLKYTAETILTNLGRRSVVYLLNRLMHSQSKEERLQLIKLIPGTGNVAVPVLVECLDKKPPWYVIRNIVFIISELNNGSLYPIVSPYLSHHDIRVQQQVLSCMVKISGGKLQSRLIEALPLVHDDLKMQIIMQLSQIGGDEVVGALLDLLHARDTLNRETYIELLVKICVAFKFSSTKDVIPALNGLIDERQKHAGPSDPVIVAARDTLLVLEPRYRHQSQAIGTDSDFEQNDYRFNAEDDKTGSIRRIERSVKELVAQGDLERAGQKLFANAVTAARDKDFASAELLRDKMLEIN
ncbi:MAG: HEAT repeat domain-containing protein, partial [Desulfofustis sp.]|nr:HEAT repeat domain-containing protein [Desulfofustis sp.]